MKSDLKVLRVGDGSWLVKDPQGNVLRRFWSKEKLDAYIKEPKVGFPFSWTTHSGQVIKLPESLL